MQLTRSVCVCVCVCVCACVHACVRVCVCACVRESVWSVWGQINHSPFYPVNTAATNLGRERGNHRRERPGTESADSSDFI